MSVNPQDWHFDTVLYGASYYHEYMPEDRLEADIALMVEAGLTVVRLGESSWGLWEPHDGAFEHARMDRILDAMHKAGIKAIMGTPTYSVPTGWCANIPRFSPSRIDGKSHAMACGRTWIPTMPPTAIIASVSFAAW
ncbi:beta-galactosidase [Devosia sp. A8/3-2]|nr:beta-galactosidase [Devosia sp. A8/3-2]